MKETAKIFRNDYFLAFFLFAISLVLYAITTSNTVLLEDDGLFLMTGAFGSVSHPPGYPIYSLLTALFMQLPWGTMAFKGHLVSMVLGSTSVAMLYLVTRKIGATMTAAFIAAMLFAISEHFWSQAVIAEVYSLNMLLFLLILWFVIRAKENPTQIKRWLLVSMSYGFSLANHWPLMVLSFPAFFILALPLYRFWKVFFGKMVLVLLMTVILPYLWMVWRLQSDVLISFYGSLDTLRDIWFYISRKGYAAIDSSPSAGWIDRGYFTRWFLYEVFIQLTVVGSSLAILGSYVLYKRKKEKTLFWALNWLFFANSLLLITLLKFDYTSLNIAVFRPYPLISYAVLAIFFSIGWSNLENRLNFKMKKYVLPLIGVGLAMILLFTNYSVNNRSDSVINKEYAEALFSLIPEGGALMVNGDIDTAPLGYFRYVENKRPDISLYNSEGLLFNNRLFKWNDLQKIKNEAIHGFVREFGKDIFFSPGMSILNSYGHDRYGFVSKINFELSKNEERLVFDKREKQFFEYLMSHSYVDEWEKRRKDVLIFNYGQFLGKIIMHETYKNNDDVQRLVTLAKDNFYCILGMMESLVQLGSMQYQDKINELISEADGMTKEGLFNKEREARFLYLKAFFALSNNQRNKGIGLLNRSINLYDHPENNAFNLMKQLNVQPKKRKR